MDLVEVERREGKRKETRSARSRVEETRVVGRKKFKRTVLLSLVEGVSRVVVGGSHEKERVGGGGVPEEEAKGRKESKRVERRVERERSLPISLSLSSFSDH